MYRYMTDRRSYPNEPAILGVEKKSIGRRGAAKNLTFDSETAAHGMCAENFCVYTMHAFGWNQLHRRYQTPVTTIEASYDRVSVWKR